MISEMILHNKNKVKLHYDITLACNNRCEYCYALEDLDNSKLFDSDTFENFIDQCNKLGEQSESNEPEVHVDILGGEPLLLLDKVFELIDRVKHNNFRIFSNFNFKNKEKIEMLKNFVLTSDKNIQIFVSVHESSNQEILKRNILYIKDLVEITLLLNDNNIDYNFEFYTFLKENKIKYGVEELINSDGSSSFSKIQNEKFKEMIQNSNMFVDKVSIDSEVFTHLEVLENDLLNISSKCRTICELSELRIKYNGDIEPICNNPIKLGNIFDSLIIKNIYCNSFNCRCSANSYKKLFNYKGNK